MPFPTTRYTLLALASGEPSLREQALGALTDAYWEPSYRYVRLRFRRSHEDAQDLVQGFFAALIEQELLARYVASRGRFRSYLRACLDHFVLKRQESDRREKRGGFAVLVPLDGDIPAGDGSGTPEQIFYREWRRRMFALALGDLERLCVETGRTVRYQVFAAYDLADEPRPTYEELAQAHSLAVTTVTNHLAWARRELRRALEARLAAVTSGERERGRELRALLGGEPA